MDSDMVPKIAACISAVAVILSAATLIVMLNDDDSGLKDSKYTFYIGLNADATDAEITSVETEVKSIIVNEYGSGYTCLGEAEGGFAEDDTVVQQRTLVFVVLFLDDSQARSIADHVRTYLSAVESVLVEKTGADTWFV